jgi:hypothetical protein
MCAYQKTRSARLRFMAGARGVRAVARGLDKKAEAVSLWQAEQLSSLTSSPCSIRCGVTSRSDGKTTPKRSAQAAWSAVVSGPPW